MGLQYSSINLITILEKEKIKLTTLIFSLSLNKNSAKLPGHCRRFFQYTIKKVMIA